LSTEPYLATPIAFIVFFSIVITVGLFLSTNLRREFTMVFIVQRGTML
jgi:hypothetical protein